MSRTTSSVSFYCRESKKNKQGLAPVELGICLNGQRRFINLPIKFTPEDFNKKRQPKEITDTIEVWRMRISQYMTDMLTNSIPLTVDNLRGIIQTGGIQTYTINNLFDDYLEILSKRIGTDLSKGVYRKYELIKEKFSQYIDFNKECTTISNHQIRSFYATLNQTYDGSTTASMMTKLKSFITYGIDNNRIQINPFQGVKIVKPKREISYLSEGELRILIETELENKSLQKVLDMFLLMCASGLAYSDLKGLDKKDVKEHNGTLYIAKKRVKNGQDYTSVILPFGRAILDKYEKLPVISNQKMNAYLGAISDILGLSQKLHCHLARHSYATLLLNKSVNLTTVSKCLGHSNTKITQQFYAKLLDTTVIEEVSRIF